MSTRRVMDLVHDYGAACWTLGSVTLDGTPESNEKWATASQRESDALFKLIRHLPEEVRNAPVIDDEEADQ